MTGLSARTLWRAYGQTGYVFTSDRHRHLRAVLHDALTAKLDVDAAERDALRSENAALREAVVMARDMLTEYPPHIEDYGGDWYCGPCEVKLPGKHADDCEYQQTLAACNAALEVKA